jgi:hypothetical protein
LAVSIVSWPPGGHGVARVDGEVYEDLFERAGVRADPPQSAARNGHDVDVGSDQPPQHLVDPGQNLVEVEHAGLDDLLAAEHQQLPGEVRGSLTRAADLDDVGSDRILRLQVHQQHVRVAQHDREQVVEVVRHTARELADGVHLLRLPQLVLELLAIRDVLGERQEADKGPVGAQHGHVVPLAGDRGSALVEVLGLVKGLEAARPEAFEDGSGGRPRRVGDHEVQGMLAEHVRLRETEDPLCGLVPAGDGEVLVGQQVGQGHALDLELQLRE